MTERASQQVKIDKIAKNMIPNANSAERNPNAQRKDMGVYFDTEMLLLVAHTFTKNVACVFYEIFFS